MSMNLREKSLPIAILALLNFLKRFFSCLVFAQLEYGLYVSFAKNLENAFSKSERT